jgi:EAL domain-containing protein (putative c-di-GMP-specific phosphodiesterase class I)
MQPPDQFIPLAEKMGLIVPLGAWVLEEVMERIGQWAARGLGRPWVAVNVAAAQLQRPEALAELRDRLSINGAAATQIEIELTESEFIDPTPSMLANLASLRELGVTVAIDDFGTGYSSFRYLRSLPIDKIKIDQSFVRRMTAESGDEAIVRGMIGIGRDLGLTVVAEGVETAEQRDILMREGCEVGQGYFYSRPVPPEAFERMLAEKRTLPLTQVNHGAPARRKPVIAVSS